MTDADFYDSVWQRYAHLDAVSPAAFHRRRVIVELATRSAASATDVLDAGCGQGELLIELETALPRAKISGADLSPQSLSDARQRHPDAELFVLDLAAPDFEQAHAERLGRYDLIVSSEVIEHIPRDGLAVDRLFRLIRPGGHLIVSVPGGRMSRFDVAIGHQRHYRKYDLENLLQRAGFEDVVTIAWGFPFHSLYRTAVRLASRVTLPDRAASDRPNGESGFASAALGKSYELFGRVLKPLFYLNLPRWGEQMFAVARRPA